MWAGEALQQFDVPGLAGAVGLRRSASWWLFVQPAGEPPFADHVSFATGDVGVEVDLTQPADVDASMAVDIAHQVAALAG